MKNGSAPTPGSPDRQRSKDAEQPASGDRLPLETGVGEAVEQKLLAQLHALHALASKSALDEERVRPAGQEPVRGVPRPVQHTREAAPRRRGAVHRIRARARARRQRRPGAPVRTGVSGVPLEGSGGCLRRIER